MRTFRFRIYPSKRQIDMLDSTLNLSRELYNAMLQQRIYAYRSGRRVNYRSQQDEIPAIKERLPEYRSIHSLVVQDVARRLDKAQVRDMIREKFGIQYTMKQVWVILKKMGMRHAKPYSHDKRRPVNAENILKKT